MKDIHLLEFITAHFHWQPDRVKRKKTYCRLNFSKAFIMNLMKIFCIRKRKSYGDVVFPDFLTQTQMKFFLLGLLYSDGNSKITILGKRQQFAVRFLQSYYFCIRLLKWIQENTDLYLHYNENSIQKIKTKTCNYDVACLELAGIDCVKFVRWLWEDVDDLIPLLDRKISPMLNLNIENFKEITKTLVQQRFTNKEKRAWTSQEVANLKQYILENSTYTNEMIGHHFDRSSHAIGHKRKELRIFSFERTETTLHTRIPKNPSFKYKPEEISLIQQVLNSTEQRSYSVLVDLVHQLNTLPCNENKIPRTIRGVRSFIKKNIDKI